MERALDPERLRRALGSAAGMPSPEALGELLAEIEVGLFLRQPRLPDELLSSAWYLHGVASAESAPELYPLDRRRAAWQVSAHVFDLALENDQDTLHERLRYGFAAQVGYLKGELTPNAMAIHRRLEPLITAVPDVRESIEVAGLTLGTTFLRLDWGRLRSMLDRVDDQLAALALASGLDDHSSTPYSALWSVSQGCRLLMRYMQSGDRESLAAADAVLQSAVNAPRAAERYLDVRWVAAHLRSLAGDFGAASVWEVLPPDVPTAVRRTFTMGQPAVSILWPPQVELVSPGGGVSALDPSARRIVLSVPTSSGKTLISQLFTLCHLAARRGGVCYVVPTRSLAREVRRDLASRLRLYSRSVAPEQFEWTNLDDRTSDEVEVLTPERLSHLIRTDVDGLLDRFGLFIFDEAHSIGDESRGFTVETCISLLHWLTRNTSHRIMLMSAALGNRGQIRSWVDPDGTGCSAASEWRGPRRLHAVFNTQIRWQTEQPILETSRSKDWPGRLVRNVYGRVRLRPTSTGKIVDLSTTEAVGRHVTRVDAKGVPETDPATGRTIKHVSSSTPNYKMLPDLIKLVAEAGPVLIIRSTRKQTQHLAKVLAESLPTSTETRELAELSAVRLGDAHPLTSVLRHGVAYHHGGLPTDVLDGIEDAVRNGRLQYIIATTSLTDGVNLPVRTVIIDEPSISNEWARPLTPAQTLNAVGRAGRSCLESEGWAILVRQAQVDPSDFDRLNPPDSELEVRSPLAQPDALAALAEFEELQRTTHDAVFTSAGSIVSDFVSFIWLVLTAHDEIADTGRAVRLEGALPSTLAWIQLDETVKQRWRLLANSVAASYFEADATHRRRWGRVATSVGSARALDALADEIAESAKKTAADLSQPWNCLALLQSHGVIERLYLLPEGQRLKKIYTAASGKSRQEVPIDHGALLRHWMSGTQINQLADEFLGTVPALDYRYEQLGDYLTERFEHHLAWLVNTLVEWTNQRLESSPSCDQVLCPELGGYVRYGTSHPLALQLFQQGVRSRDLGNKIAIYGRDQGWVDFDEMQEGLRTLGPTSWAQLFQPSVGDLRDLLDIVRDRETPLLSRVLDGETVRIPVAPWDPFALGAAIVAVDDSESLFGSLRVSVSGSPVADIPTRHHSEISALLELGVPITVHLEYSGPGHELTIALDQS